LRSASFEENRIQHGGYNNDKYYKYKAKIAKLKNK
jgi:hypothetical protein